MREQKKAVKDVLVLLLSYKEMSGSLYKVTVTILKLKYLATDQTRKPGTIFLKSLNS